MAVEKRIPAEAATARRTSRTALTTCRTNRERTRVPSENCAGISRISSPRRVHSARRAASPPFPRPSAIVTAKARYEATWVAAPLARTMRSLTCGKKPRRATRWARTLEAGPSNSQKVAAILAAAAAWDSAATSVLRPPKTWAYLSE